nr:MAG TPA: hypothetical protein [Crassvirales sp.]
MSRISYSSNINIVIYITIVTKTSSIRISNCRSN